MMRDLRTRNRLLGAGAIFAGALLFAPATFAAGYDSDDYGSSASSASFYGSQLSRSECNRLLNEQPNATGSSDYDSDYAMSDRERQMRAEC